MKRQKITIGSILEISIEKKYYVYAQILQEGYAFFDFKSDKKLKDFSPLLQAKILFIINVDSYVVNKGFWMKVGKLPIRQDLKKLPLKFIKDELNPKHFELYNPNTGEISNATKDQCKGLERAASWANNHVEDRIRDHYLKRPNVWLEQMRIK